MAIGKPLPRVDAPAKATGRALYTDDFKRPGVLAAKCFRSTIAHGRVKYIDVQAAQALTGVIAVFTYEDVPSTPFATAGHPSSLDPNHGDVADRHILTRDIRFYGDEIAVVVAEHEAIAQKALDVPNMGCEFVETFEPTSGYGNKALGEPPVISPPPAIRNAILDATGVAINELPLTPQVLFKYFRRAGLV